jgi:hypothetical protein
MHLSHPVQAISLFSPSKREIVCSATLLLRCACTYRLRWTEERRSPPVLVTRDCPVRGRGDCAPYCACAVNESQNKVLFLPVCERCRMSCAQEVASAPSLQGGWTLDYVQVEEVGVSEMECDRLVLRLMEGSRDFEYSERVQVIRTLNKKSNTWESPGWKAGHSCIECA